MNRQVAGWRVEDELFPATAGCRERLQFAGGECGGDGRRSRIISLQGCLDRVLMGQVPLRGRTQTVGDRSSCGQMRKADCGVDDCDLRGGNGSW